MSDKQESKQQDQQPIGKMTIAAVDAEFAKVEGKRPATPSSPSPLAR